MNLKPFLIDLIYYDTKWLEIDQTNEGLVDKFCYGIRSTLRAWSEEIMPPKHKKASDNRVNDGFRFVNINLKQSDKTEFMKWVKSIGEEIHTELAAFIQNGYKASVRYDFDHSCFIATWTCVDDGSANFNAALTSRADNYLEALLLGVYKTQQLCNDGIWDEQSESRSWG